MSYPVSELFPCWGISLSSTYLVVFLGIFPHVCSQDPQGVFPDQIWSLLILKRTVTFCLLWKQRHNPSHIVWLPIWSQDIGWFNSAVPSVIQCLSALALKKLKLTKHHLSSKLPVLYFPSYVTYSFLFLLLLWRLLVLSYLSFMTIYTLFLFFS